MKLLLINDDEETLSVDMIRYERNTKKKTNTTMKTKEELQNEIIEKENDILMSQELYNFLCEINDDNKEIEEMRYYRKLEELEELIEEEYNM